MKEKIEYIKKILDKHNKVEIHTGKLAPSEIEKLSKHFQIRNGFFGYTIFEKM